MAVEKAIKFLEYLKKDDVEKFKEKCCDYKIEESEINDIEKQYDEIIELLLEQEATIDGYEHGSI